MMDQSAIEEEITLFQRQIQELGYSGPTTSLDPQLLGLVLSFYKGDKSQAANFILDYGEGLQV